MLNRKRRGANAIEFALTLPVMLLLLGAIVDYGLYFNARSSVHQAALSGARAGAMVPADESEATAELTARAELTYYGLDGAAATVTPMIVDLNGEDAVQIDISLAYSGLIVSSIMPSSIEFTTGMRLEDQ